MSRDIVRSLPVEARVALLFGLACVLFGWVVPFTDDEGYLGYMSPAAFARAPLETFFFLKFHPFRALFFAPVALFGWKAYLALNVVIAAATVWLAGLLARRLGGSPLVASAVVALSPFFGLSAVTGQSNSAGLFFLLATTALVLSGPRAALVGALLGGASIFTRYEFAPLLGLLVAWSAWERRDWRLLPLFALFPVAYLSLGAAYHGKWLWFLAYPPGQTQVMAGHDYNFTRLELRSLLDLLLAVTMAVPAWPLLAGVRWRALPPAARVMLAAVAFELLALATISSFRMLMEAAVPRYQLVLLPFVAIVLALPSGRPPSPVESLWRRAGPFVAGAVLLALVVVGGGRWGRWSVASSDLRAAAQSFVRPGETRVVYTTHPSLAVYAAWASLPLDVRFLPQADVLLELGGLLNADNGQRVTMLPVLEGLLYGRAVFPCTLAAATLEPDQVFLLKRDDRLDATLPSAFWQAHTELVEESGEVVVRKARRGITRLDVPRRGGRLAAFYAPCGMTAPVSARDGASF